ISTMVKDKTIIPYNGFCVTHNRITNDEIDKALNNYKGALLLVHPECSPDVVRRAHFVGSTSAIIDFARNSPNKRFIIGTEIGVMHKLENDNKGSGKEFYLLSDSLVCSNMKKNKLEDVYNCLKYETNEISIDEDIRIKAKITLDKMLELS
ncbi:MAG: quinolinate synthase NadA, partial [Clostridium sp.]